MSPRAATAATRDAASPPPPPPRRRVRLTRLYRFNAGHRLWDPRRDERWNRRVFGKCSLPGGHGHNYVLEVTLEGGVDLASGLLVDRRRLDAAVDAAVIEPIDHRNLNEVLDLEIGPAPTTEVLIVEIWRRLAPRIAALSARARLLRLRLSETAKNSFEYEGRGEG